VNLSLKIAAVTILVSFGNNCCLSELTSALRQMSLQRAVSSHRRGSAGSTLVSIHDTLKFLSDLGASLIHRVDQGLQYCKESETVTAE